MLGAEGVTGRIVARLQESLPDKVIELRTRYRLDAGPVLTALDIPDFKAIQDWENDQLSVEEWPAIFVLEQDTDRQGGAPTRQSDGYRDMFAYSYRIRLFVWIRGRDYEDTGRKRQRLMLAVREVLIARPGMLEDLDTGETIVLDLSRMFESSSDVAVDNAGRTIAGGIIEGYFDTQEHLAAWDPPVAVQGPPTITFEVLPP